MSQQLSCNSWWHCQSKNLSKNQTRLNEDQSFRNIGVGMNRILEFFDLESWIQFPRETFPREKRNISSRKTILARAIEDLCAQLGPNKKNIEKNAWNVLKLIIYDSMRTHWGSTDLIFKCSSDFDWSDGLYCAEGWNFSKRTLIYYLRIWHYVVIPEFHCLW